MRKPEQDIVDLRPDVAASRLRVIRNSLMLSQGLVEATGTSMLKVSLSVAWICVAAFLIEREPPMWGRLTVLVSLAGVLAYLVWHEVAQYCRLRRAPTHLTRTYWRLWIASVALVSACSLALEAGLITRMAASTGAFAIVGMAFVIYGRLLNHGLQWVAFFAIPWWVAALLAATASRGALLLIAAAVCVVGGAVPGLIVRYRACRVDWMEYEL